MRTVYDFSVKDRKGKMVCLKEYANEVLLIVNTATRCGFTPQYEELEQLYEKYHQQGFEVLDFPCNQFGLEPAHRLVKEPKSFASANSAIPAQYGLLYLHGRRLSRKAHYENGNACQFSLCRIQGPFLVGTAP